MISKILKQMLRRKFTTGVTLLAIFTGGYFVYQNLTKDKNGARYILAAAEKGALVVSVSGSGQVVALDQIEIKPKASGDIAALYIEKGQEVKKGQLVATLDSTDAEKAIRDAEVALDSAKAKLEELLSQPDEKSLLQAKNSLTQAERDLDKAKESYEEVEIEAERSLTTAYEDGYSTVSTSLFKMSDYTQDLKDVLGTEQNTEGYISSYKLILGSESSYVQKLLDDYYRANSLFDKDATFFREAYKHDSRDTVYKLIEDTLEATKAISQALESARHMFDAIKIQGYEQFYISSHIDKMQPKIESDISAVYSNISSLQKIKDTIDDVNDNAPKKVRDAELAIESAQENLDEKKLALDELVAGVDLQEIKSQQNTVAQKEDDLLEAKENLAEYFIRAPLDGFIAELNLNIKRGESASAGTVLASVITQQKIAEISLNEVDVAQVETGQRATLVFDALPEITVSGKVLDVDTVGTTVQGVVSYGVKITFDSEEEKVKPGMSVTAEIITNAKQDVLVLPSSAIKSQGNSYYVELVEVDNDELREQLLAGISGAALPEPPKLQAIEIGISNDLSTEIINGLKDGDIVVASTISQDEDQSAQSRGNQTFQMPGMATPTRSFR